jgi:hypothetical protein
MSLNKHKPVTYGDGQKSNLAALIYEATTMAPIIQASI